MHPYNFDLYSKDAKPNSLLHVLNLFSNFQKSFSWKHCLKFKVCMSSFIVFIWFCFHSTFQFSRVNIYFYDHLFTFASSRLQENWEQEPKLYPISITLVGTTYGWINKWPTTFVVFMQKLNYKKSYLVLESRIYTVLFFNQGKSLFWS